jgi:uncharacterized protein (TIGR02118 family)
MIQRIVCFRFKNDAGDDKIKAHMDDFAALADKIPAIKSYYGGRAISGDKGAPPEYDTLHYLTFDSMEDVDTYFHHEEHQAFIERNRANKNRKVLVLNANID